MRDAPVVEGMHLQPALGQLPGGHAPTAPAPTTAVLTPAADLLAALIRSPASRHRSVTA
ncbi:hypothetical protein [Nonomuraea sp. NPDC049784]|uniref:hypothetical protein n=1 Tax=Nonomuraea sp. NPDC049784 TaxID=3154361 RepID=UPI0033DBE442